MEKEVAINKKTIIQIKDEEQRKLSELFKMLGIFFAFSTEQFNSQKQEGVKYVSAGAGMIIPVANVEEFSKQFDKLNEDTREQYDMNITMDEYILFELYNHEAMDTGDLEYSFEAITQEYPECTMEDVERVYYDNIK